MVMGTPQDGPGYFSSAADINPATLAVLLFDEFLDEEQEMEAALLVATGRV